jgi:Zn-dependent protease
MRVIAFWLCTSAVALLFGVIVHELAHYLVALACGWRIHGIRGVRRGRRSLSLGLYIAPRPIESESIRLARQRLRTIALAGPASNLVVGVLLWSINALGSQVGLRSTHKTGFLMVLGLIQLGLGISNLIPSQKGTILGNDGNVVFRICRNNASYRQALELLGEDQERAP